MKTEAPELLLRLAQAISLPGKTLLLTATGLEAIKK